MASRGAALLLTCLYFYGVGYAECACNVSELAGRVDALLAEYDRGALPAAPAQVQLALDLRHAAVSDHTDSMRILADLHMSWDDDRLSWNSTEWGCSWVLVSGERVWTPDVRLANAGISSVAREQLLAARLASTGRVAWTARLDLAVPLQADLSAWPDDQQAADFKFASRAHAQDELDLSIKEADSLVVESGAWQVESLSGSVSSLGSAVAGASGRRVAAWRVTLRRRAPAQLHAARATLAGALLLLAAAALLPPAQRAPLAAAAAFILALWLCVSVWRVGGGGGGGRGAPRAVSRAGGVLAAAGAAAAGAGAVLRVARLTSPPPHLVKTVVAAAHTLAALSPLPEGGESGTWAAAARLLDAVLLILIAFAVFILLCVYSP